MTEETTQVENTQAETAQPENQGINISIEQILAAILVHVGPVTVPLEKMVANYSDKTIAVNQNEDKSVVFAVVDLPKTEEVVEEAAE